MAVKVSSTNQELFRNLILGILVYSVVLGFFNDYTDILYTGTYSTTFAVAIVMQILTMLTFRAKDNVVLVFKKKEDRKNNFGLVFSIWLIMFFSKFVFLAVIDIVFQNQVKISGFVGLLLIIVTVTIVQKIIELIYSKLGQPK